MRGRTLFSKKTYEEITSVLVGERTHLQNLLTNGGLADSADPLSDHRNPRPVEKIPRVSSQCLHLTRTRKTEDPRSTCREVLLFGANNDDSCVAHFVLVCDTASRSVKISSTWSGTSSEISTPRDAKSLLECFAVAIHAFLEDTCEHQEVGEEDKDDRDEE